MIISHELIGKAEPAPLYLHINSGGGDLMASPDFIKNALAAALGPEKAKELNAATIGIGKGI